ncbi:MAG: hypothetical protein QOG25_1305 [Acetobacteraceae bacterium]|nr:hypothetical protein [Acetobacteraceae bacterium]
MNVPAITLLSRTARHRVRPCTAWCLGDARVRRCLGDARVRRCREDAWVRRCLEDTRVRRCLEDTRESFL